MLRPGRIAMLTVAAFLRFVAPASPQPPPAPIPLIGPGVTAVGCFIQSDFLAGGKHNFELVALEGSSLVHYWRANDPAETGREGATPWRKGAVISTRAMRPGCLVQSDFMSGGHGNLEVVVPEIGGALVHYWHDSGQPGSGWNQSGVVTTGVTGGACFITSDYTTNGHRNFEVMVQKGNQLWHHWHLAGADPDNWPGELITTGVTAVGPGCVIQSDYQVDGHRNFEVVVQKGTQLWHHWRWNGMAGGPWPGKPIVEGVTAPGCLFASDFKAGAIRNFEVVVLKGNTLSHHWRWDGMTDERWPGANIVSGITGSACFLQGDFTNGVHANFELVVPALVQPAGLPAINEVVHYFRVQDEGRVWERAQSVSFHGRSEKVCQLTSEADWESGVPTSTRTQSRFGLGATDLGYPVEHQGRLALLFGDSWAGHQGHAGAGRGERAKGEIEPADDPVGWISSSAAPTAAQCTDLVVNHLPLAPPVLIPARVAATPPVKHGYFNVPSGGVSHSGGLFAFFWTNHCQDPQELDRNPPHPLARPGPHPPIPDKDHTADDWCPETDDRNSTGRGVLARSDDGGMSFSRAVPMPPGFVYATALDATAATGLPPAQRLGTYVFAVPRYRASTPYLAYAPPGLLSDPGSWLFYIGRRQNGDPIWTSFDVWNRGAAQPWRPPGSPELFASDRCIGEFSVTWNQPLGVWLMLYNCDQPGEPGVIRARTARAPWGPWSASTAILSPPMDGAPCRLVMAANGCGNQERYHRQDVSVPGSFYAPFVIDRYTTALPPSLFGARRATIYWLVSTWDPYQVVIMRTTLEQARSRQAGIARDSPAASPADRKRRTGEGIAAKSSR